MKLFARSLSRTRLCGLFIYPSRSVSLSFSVCCPLVLANYLFCITLLLLSCSCNLLCYLCRYLFFFLCDSLYFTLQEEKKTKKNNNSTFIKLQYLFCVWFSSLGIFYGIFIVSLLHLSGISFSICSNIFQKHFWYCFQLDGFLGKWA